MILGVVNSDILSNNPSHVASKMEFITKLYQYKQLIEDATRVPKDHD